MTNCNIFAKTCIVMLLFPAFMILRCDCEDSFTLWSDMMYYAEVVRARSYKHQYCFPFNSYDCDGSLIPKPYYEEFKWFYNPMLKACAPLYKPVEKDFNCDSVKNLPNNRKICEDLCGEPCTIIYKNKLTEPGICMTDCHIPLTADNWQTCPLSAKCCPRGYLFPTTTPVPVTTKQPVNQFTMQTIMMNMKHENASEIQGSSIL